MKTLKLFLFPFSFTHNHRIVFPKSFKRSKGFTLVEMLLTLAVMAFLLIAAFIIYPQVDLKMRVNNELSGYRSIIASIRSLYIYPPYAGLNNGLLRRGNFIPNNFTLPEGTNAIKNNWGGTINISGWGNNDAVPGGTFNRIRLVTTAIPQEACIPMAQGFFSYADQAYVAPTGQPPWSASYLVSSNDPAKIVQLCSAENTIGFTVAIFFKP